MRDSYILFLRDRVEYVVAGGCRGCLPCNSCQPSVERIASSLSPFQFCLFVLSPFSQQSEHSFYENPDTFYFVLFPAVLWGLKWLGSTCDFWHLGLYEKWHFRSLKLNSSILQYKQLKPKNCNKLYTIISSEGGTISQLYFSVGFLNFILIQYIPCLRAGRDATGGLDPNFAFLHFFLNF